MRAAKTLITICCVVEIHAYTYTYYNMPHWTLCLKNVCTDTTEMVYVTLQRINKRSGAKILRVLLKSSCYIYLNLLNK